MLEWNELAALAAGGPTWVATAVAADGAELRVEVWGERPGIRRRIVLAKAVQEQQPCSWALHTKTRPPTAAELVEAAHIACQGSPEWWAVLAPWRGDLEGPPLGAEAFTITGFLIGPIPEEGAGLVQLAVGSAPALQVGAGNA